MTHHHTQRLNDAVLDEARAFATLKQEWDELYADSPLATPFQSWAWLYSWWEIYGENYDLRLITIRAGGLLVGILPMMLERRWGLFGRLLFIGKDSSDYLDLLARGGWEERVAEVGVDALWQINSGRVIDLQQLRPEAAAWGVFRRWPGPRSYLRQAGCPVIEVRPEDELLASVSKNLRSTARRAIRRAEEDNVHRRLADAEDAEQAVGRLLQLHLEMRRGRDIAPEHSTERFESFLAAAVRRLTACDLGGISEFRRDGEVVASHFLVFGRGFVGEHLWGAKQAAARRYQVSSLNVWDAVSIARSRGSTRVDLLRGEEPYKLRWASDIIINHRAVLGKSAVFGRLFLACLLLYSKIRGYASA